MRYYLDENGLATLWERIKLLVRDCGGSGGGGCSCQEMTNEEIDALTPIECGVPCDLSEHGDLVLEYSGYPERGLS